MDAGEVPEDFEQHKIARSRESIQFEADMERAFAASRQGFERQMSIREPGAAAANMPNQAVVQPVGISHQQVAPVYTPVLVI